MLIELDLGSERAEFREIIHRVDCGRLICDVVLLAVPVQIEASPPIRLRRENIALIPLVAEFDHVENLSPHVERLIQDKVDVEIILVSLSVIELVPPLDVDILESDDAVEHRIVFLQRTVEWLEQTLQGLVKRSPVFNGHFLQSSRLRLHLLIVQYERLRLVLALDNFLTICDRH